MEFTDESYRTSFLPLVTFGEGTTVRVLSYARLQQLFVALGQTFECRLHDFEEIFVEVAKQPDHPNLTEAIYTVEQVCPKTLRAEQDAKHLAFLFNLITKFKSSGLSSNES